MYEIGFQETRRMQPVCCHATDGPPTTGPAGPSTANFVAIDGPAGLSMAAMDGPAGLSMAAMDGLAGLSTVP